MDAVKLLEQYCELLQALFDVGGQVFHEAYPMGIDAVTVTWVRFDDETKFGRYVAIIDNKIVGCDVTKSKVEDSLSLLG